MSIAEKKKLIIDKIEATDQEWVIRAIEKLLDIEDKDESPDWHLPLVKEALEEYQKSPDHGIDWEDLKKEWDGKK